MTTFANFYFFEKTHSFNLIQTPDNSGLGYE